MSGRNFTKHKITWRHIPELWAFIGSGTYFIFGTIHLWYEMPIREFGAIMSLVLSSPTMQEMNCGRSGWEMHF